MDRNALLDHLAQEMDHWPAPGSLPEPPIKGIWTCHGQQWRCYAKDDNRPIEKDDWWSRRIALLSHINRKVVSMKRIYISGPMTGLPDLNASAFHTAAAELRALGYDVVNPAEVQGDAAAPWEEWLKADLREMLTCDIIALLPGWQASKGAHLEMHVAHRVGMTITDLSILLEQEPAHAHLLDYDDPAERGHYG